MTYDISVEHRPIY